MSWLYSVSTGNFADPSGIFQGKGYSGQPPHTNDRDSEFLKNEGPIPEGLWQAVELIPESATHGPFAIRLEPYAHTVTYGRSGFMIHGDSIEHPGYASDGCIILDRELREMFWASEDHDLEVVG